MKPSHTTPADTACTWRDLSPIDRRELALAALVDDRSLERFIHGEPIRHLTRERIMRALRERGLEHLLPAEGVTR
jgi:hypothetical protein